MASTVNMQLRYNSDGTFFGLGHPMLDISTQVSLDFLERFDLKVNNVVLAQNVPKYDEISKEILIKGNYNSQYSAGGSTQNTLKTISWLLGQANVTVCMGCIGQDGFGKILTQQMENCLYQTNSKSPTATCLILITDETRSMITNLGAANEFTIDYLITSENWAHVERAQIFYVPGYFIRTCSKAVLKLAHHATERRKIFAFNLSAEYICQKFGDHIRYVLPFVDFLFGNEQEAKCFAQHQMNINMNNDMISITKELQKLLTKNTETYVIITRGADSIIVASNHGVQLFPVQQSSQIVDTTGCGDAFVGGFLAYQSLNRSIDDCINAACYCAYECLSRTGCQFSNKPSFNSTQTFLM